MKTLNIFPKIRRRKKLLCCIVGRPFLHLLLLRRHMLIRSHICIIVRQWQPLLLNDRHMLLVRNFGMIYRQWGTLLLTFRYMLTDRDLCWTESRALNPISISWRRYEQRHNIRLREMSDGPTVKLLQTIHIVAN